eukprot:523380-Pyramimonas_sp.AAC.1
MCEGWPALGSRMQTSNSVSSVASHVRAPSVHPTPPVMEPCSPVRPPGSPRAPVAGPVPTCPRSCAAQSATVSLSRPPS